MSLEFRPPSALEHFASLIRQDVGLLLFEAAICLGQDADPTLDVQSVLNQVDVLAHRLHGQVPKDASALQRTYLLNTFFYEQLGFGPNANHFTDSANSYLHHVLQTRRGISVSLGILWMELAHGIGLKVDGISFPGHFLVKVHVDEGLIVQDPLTGRGLTLETLSDQLETYREKWGLSEDEMAPATLFLQPTPSRDILERMLRNLRKIHLDEGNTAMELAVLQRLLIVRPYDWTLYRERGLLHARCGQRQAAIQDLQLYVRNAATPHDLPAIEAQIELLRSGR